MHIGRNVTEVSKNLLVLGKFYDLRMDDEDFYIFDRVHSALKVVYNGVYPITDILANVRLCTNRLIIIISLRLNQY